MAPRLESSMTSPPLPKVDGGTLSGKFDVAAVIAMSPGRPSSAETLDRQEAIDYSICFRLADDAFRNARFAFEAQ